MLLFFPVFYVLAFIIALRGILKQNENAIFIYIIGGLPIYNTALTIIYGYHLKEWMPILQSFKEVLVFAMITIMIWNYKKRFKLVTMDKWVLAFLLYSSIYLFVPLGKYAFFEKLIALKSLSFFTIIYFAGRLMNFDNFYFEKIFIWIGILCFAAAILMGFEIITYTHFQTYTDYAYFNQDYYGLDVSGNYGLSWSFEINDGFKRFASFFANPLEMAGGTLVAASFLLSNYTTIDNKLKIDKFGWMVAIVTTFSLFFALSRSSLLGYILLVYVYALMTNKREIIFIFYVAIGAALVYLVYLLNDRNTYDYIISTFQLADSSSVGHVLEWLEGIQSLLDNPLGRGLGESGRVSAALQENIGGENQFIIVGVQTGIISLSLYLLIYIISLRYFWMGIHSKKLIVRRLGLSLFLMKIAFIVPMMTSNFDSYSYILYLSWLLTGIFITAFNENQIINSWN
jgi:O-antigen ligase